MRATRAQSKFSWNTKFDNIAFNSGRDVIYKKLCCCHIQYNFGDVHG